MSGLLGSPVALRAPLPEAVGGAISRLTPRSSLCLAFYGKNPYGGIFRPRQATMPSEPPQAPVATWTATSTDSSRLRTPAPNVFNLTLGNILPPNTHSAAETRRAEQHQPTRSRSPRTPLRVVTPLKLMVFPPLLP